MRVLKTDFACTSILYSLRKRVHLLPHAISVIASEEFGKAFGLAEIVFQASFNKWRFHAEDAKFVRALLSVGNSWVSLQA
jgi:hypothetical protein